MGNPLSRVQIDGVPIVPKFVDVCTKCYRSIVVLEATGFYHKESRCEHGTEFVVRYWPKDE